MAHIKIRRGLDLPIGGAPEQVIRETRPVKRVAVLGDDFVGMKPTMEVAEGDRVRTGQLLFTDKKNAGVRYTAPGTGIVTTIHRGAKRKFESLIIELDGSDEAEEFPAHAPAQFTALTRETVRENLLASGLWTSLRTRPFSRVPSPEEVPDAIFVNAMDTRPLAADPVVILKESPDSFLQGLHLLARLTDGPVYVCHKPDADIPRTAESRFEYAAFSGPHPAGLPGTHIHFLRPVGEKHRVWHLDYQDAMAIGTLFRTGRLPVQRIIACAGPSVKNPRLIRTRLGASLQELAAGEIEEENVRLLSGCVLSGRKGSEQTGFLGRYHLQITALPEGSPREFLDWLRPGRRKFSVRRVYTGAVVGKGTPRIFTTSQEGSERAIVPIGMYEQVMPMDILATFLLRALCYGDDDQAQALGALELDEEDLALASFVCSGKGEYGPLLRQCLDRIEKEGFAAIS